MVVALLMMFSVIPDPLSTVVYSTPVNPPTGNFYINGEKATATSTHTVTSPTLEIKFVATAYGEEITKVRVVRRNPDKPYDPVSLELDETTTNQEWTGTHELPGPGTYKVLGYIYAPAFDNGGYLQLMSLLGTWTGDEGTFDGESISEGLLQPTFSWLNIPLLIVGVTLLGVGGYWEKKS